MVNISKEDAEFLAGYDVPADPITRPELMRK